MNNDTNHVRELVQREGGGGVENFKLRGGGASNHKNLTHPVTLDPISHHRKIHDV